MADKVERVYDPRSKRFVLVNALKPLPRKDEDKSELVPGANYHRRIEANLLCEKRLG